MTTNAITSTAAHLTDKGFSQLMRRDLIPARLHAALEGRWPDILERLGIHPDYLRNRHGPCPACGGKDRYRFDDYQGRGDFFCNQCGAGDGFALLQKVHGWSFPKVLNEVARTAGLPAPVGEPSHMTGPRPATGQRDDRDKASIQKRAADKAVALWAKATQPHPTHQYLRGKGIAADGIRQLRESLVVPVRDVQAKLWSLQFINPRGEKRFLRGGRTKGCFHVIGKRTPRVWLVEGYATGMSVHQDYGDCVVVAFCCENLLPVATAITEEWKSVELTVMADDDWNTPGNPGHAAAERVAERLGCAWHYPEFPPARPPWATDYNDAQRLWRTRGAVP
ncbi:MAG: primase-helicase zinc-binding domain-containing protein [Gammaproteobacteria bacterium]